MTIGKEEKIENIGKMQKKWITISNKNIPLIKNKTMRQLFADA